ncbi:MAG: hypothetical protein KME07_18390 [Pegethrix bostrychoides GSE-TBD4-15B]|jgi:hypothetical protein|uniref:Uncharacterized protein n=1 Tax=Pegethrix bostrychoides GSE-TBD4-15B TaxID=2839662 RepID=A0A951U605_9CYAN|nr:hypothetical protein [Pegethrix bostrychoides GSE-TBD4-15B]
MNALNSSTRRRLQQLRQIPAIWEGDRRVLDRQIRSLETDSRQGDCILWVDGMEGLVRAMDVVSSDAGHEAVVRALLQAMESPQGAGMPARPQKILVRDRELQFFLRGVLQELGITVDYVADLPLIDEIFQGMQSLGADQPPELPPNYAEPILTVTRQIWDSEPWVVLDEEKIIAVELNYGDVETLYVSTLGMLGMEYGLLLYRSLDSLKKFRRQVMAASDQPQALEEAFLEQDCLFVTFDQLDPYLDLEPEDDPSDPDNPITQLFAQTGVRPSFGNLHPLEGMRPVLYEEEARLLLVALTALQRFFQQHLSKLDVETFPALSSRYRIPAPGGSTQTDSSNKSSKLSKSKPTVSVAVSTLPEVAAELFEMSMGDSDAESELDLGMPMLHNDLIPDDAFYSLGAMPWDTFDVLRQVVETHQPSPDQFTRGADGFPVILIQTSRPKAKALIAEIQAAGGLQAICFNPGEDPLSEEQYDLGILQTQDGELHLFGEFYEQDPVHIQARKKWDQRCKKTKGFCGLVIARGLKGASRGNPQLNDMMALFEARAITEQDLGLGSLQLIPYVE